MCFAIFVKNSKIQNVRYFWQDKNVLKIGMGTLKRYPTGQKFHRNCSNFLKIGMTTPQTYPVGQKFVEIALSQTVFEIQAFLCFAIFVKNWKIQNGCYFWQDKNILKIGMATRKRYPTGQKFHRNCSMFLKIGMATPQRYPVGQKFHRNRSITHSFRDTGIFVFSLFGKFAMIN